MAVRSLPFRDGLEQLARYPLRPPIAQDRPRRTADGRVLLTLEAEWRAGTVDLLERLTAPRRGAAQARK